MQTPLSKHIPVERWLYFFLFVHLVIWTVVPAFVRFNLPLDSIEGTIWGHQLEWGYDKNPFLNGWLTALATYLDGQSGWLIYLFSQISVVICFWVVWQLGKKILAPVYALIAVVILEGIQYYNLHAIDFNDNTLELGLWALTIYFFYHALRKPDNLSWILTGTFAALGMMAKYYTASLLAGMGLFLLLDTTNRKQLTTLPPYLGLLTFIIIILPHTIWLFFNDFITVKYVFARTDNTPDWTNHLVFPAKFAFQQLEAFVPALILFAFLFIGKKPRFSEEKIKLSRFNKAFLFYVGMGPFLLTLLLSILFGITLRAGWGMPLLSLWGIILLACFQPNITKTKMYGFLTFIYLLIAITLGCYSWSLIDSPDESSANFPGREIAQSLTKTWNDIYHTKLSYVGGSRWIGGNIGFYSNNHPAVFIEWNKQRAPWINLTDMENKGAIFVWEITNKEKMPSDIQSRFPRLQKPTVIEFNWHRNSRHLSPIKIGVAILPPKNE